MAYAVARVFAIAFVLVLCPAGASVAALTEEDKGFIESVFTSSNREGSLKNKYQAIRSLQVVGSSRPAPITCDEISISLVSPSLSAKDTYYAAKLAEILECPFADEDLKSTIASLLSTVANSNMLLDLHHSIGALSVIKKFIKEDLTLDNAVEVFNSIQALAGVDGTWKYTLSGDESSAKAAGMAFETLASLTSIAGSMIDRHVLKFTESAISKLFKSINKYDDGTFYFEEKNVDELSGAVGSIATTSCVVRGVVASALAFPGKLKIPGAEFVGLAKFFLSLGVHGSSDDTFHVLDAMGVLDANSVMVPLLLSVPSSVLSLTAKESLEVSFSTALGSIVPTEVMLVRAVKLGAKKASISSKQVLESDHKSHKHSLSLIENHMDLGKYDLTFNAKPLVDDGKYVLNEVYTTRILVTGTCNIATVEIGVLDSDTGSTDFSKRWDPSAKERVSLFATHLQKLHFSLSVLSPLDEPFTPHQIFFKMKHENHAEHLFLAKPSGKHLELKLDLLGLVEKFNYVSGAYTIELITGDDSLENSVMWALGSIELDFPEPPEGAANRSAVVDIISRYGPKPEISHIFRPAEKRAPATLSNTFFGLSVIPLLGFLVGLKLLNVNVKNFPMSGLPFIAGIAFHLGIASILGLYVMFWVKLNLFQTLKCLSILAIAAAVPGHYLLSYLADASSKVKTA